MTRDESAMTDRELMQQALDAFEKIVDGCRGVKSANPMHKDARDLATFVIVDCREPIKSISDRLAQPEREWQGLTDEEILEEYRQSYGDDGNLTDIYFAHAIEAKLKEKNGTS